MNTQPDKAVHSSDWLAFNINDVVAVRLTDHGRKIFKANRIQRACHNVAYSLKEEDSEGWSYWPMWSLFEEFGPHIGLGRKACFETNIRLKANKNS